MKPEDKFIHEMKELAENNCEQLYKVIKGAAEDERAGIYLQCIAETLLRLEVAVTAILSDSIIPK